jgi:hypothetical protein
MKNAHWWPGSLILLALIVNLEAQTAPTDSTGTALAAPTNNLLNLSTFAAEVRVLDAKGLVLETNFTYLPRLKISDLTDEELHALLETKTAYDALTTFGSRAGRNPLSPVIESQLHQIWINGKSLPEKIQTRLEILAEMNAYNTAVALLPGSVAYANQAALYFSAETNRLANKAQLASIAGSQVESAEVARAYGNDSTGTMVHNARENYQDEAARLDRANDRAAAANSLLAAANQQVTAYLHACASISALLTHQGISVSTAPPFSPIPPLSLKSEVDAERTAN